MQKLYLVAEWVVPKNEGDSNIEITGIFSTKEKAVNECKDENYFFGELELDNAIHEKHVKWPTNDPFPVKL